MAKTDCIRVISPMTGEFRHLRRPDQVFVRNPGKSAN